MNSIKFRLLAALAAVLLLFLMVTGWSINRAYQQSIVAELEARQQLQVDSLLAVMDVKDNRILMPLSLPDQALALPDSGVMAWVVSENQVAWRSLSSTSSDALTTQPVAVGESSLRQLQAGNKVFDAMGSGIEWVGLDQQSQRFTLWVAQDHQLVLAKFRQFRNRMLVVLVIASVALLAIMLLIMIWTFRPLNKAIAEVAEVRDGSRDVLSNQFPNELKPLSNAVNQLIENEQHQRQRYRDAMDDLAHSLKTPLAMLKADLGDQVTQQTAVDRIDQIVSYQLQRAAASHVVTFGKKNALKPVADKVVAAMLKVHQEKGLSIKCAVDDSISLAMEEADMMELLGNLLDNACKWAKTRVLLVVIQQQEALELLVHDDGQGFPVAQIDTLIQRGRRADESTPGQGLGLGLVADIAHAHKGEVLLERSEQLGGALVRLRFPA